MEAAKSLRNRSGLTLAEAADAIKAALPVTRPPNDRPPTPTGEQQMNTELKNGETDEHGTTMMAQWVRTKIDKAKESK
jgi:hypothetical protein